MISEEHSALADAIMDNADIDFDEAVVVARDLIQYLQRNNFEIKAITK